MADAPSHIGADLKARRVELELTPQDIQEAIGVRAAYVRAIETLDTENSASLGYMLGYVRSYASFVGMDAVDAVKRFKEDIEAPQNLAVSKIPHFVPKHKIKLPRGFVPAVGVLGFALMLGVWYGGSGATQATGPVVPVVNTLDGAEVEVTPIDPNLITLKAIAPSWIRVKDAKGETLVNRIFVTGEGYSAPRGSELSFSVRDGGAIEIHAGAENYGPIGKQGEPIKNMPFP
jgi:cytoskeletal protein RodZ